MLSWVFPQDRSTHLDSHALESTRIIITYMSKGCFHDDLKPCNSDHEDLVSISVFVIKHHVQKQLGEETDHFYLAILCSHYINEISKLRKSRQEPGCNHWCKNCGRMVLTDQMPTTLLYNSRPSAQEWHYTKLAGSSYINY